MTTLQTLSDRSFKFSNGVRCQQAVVRAMAGVKKLLTHPLAHTLFVDLAKLFDINENVEETVRSIANDVLMRGFKIEMETLSKAAMVATPYPNPHLPTLDIPIITFDKNHVQDICQTENEENRQEFFHVIKFLHEFVHLMVPGLIEATSKGTIKPVEIVELIDKENAKQSKKNKDLILNLISILNTPVKIGTVAVTARRNVGDSGSGWEEATCGGRIVIFSIRSPSLFDNNLKLIVRQDVSLPPCSGNMKTYKISDTFIANFLTQLRELTDSVALPSFRIPEESLQFIGGTFTSIGQAVVKASRKRKRARMSYSEDEAEDEEMGVGEEEEEDDDDDDENESNVAVSLSAKQYYDMVKKGRKF